MLPMGSALLSGQECGSGTQGQVGQAKEEETVPGEKGVPLQPREDGEEAEGGGRPELRILKSEALERGWA